MDELLIFLQTNIWDVQASVRYFDQAQETAGESSSTSDESRDFDRDLDIVTQYTYTPSVARFLEITLHLPMSERGYRIEANGTINILELTPEMERLLEFNNRLLSWERGISCFENSKKEQSYRFAPPNPAMPTVPRTQYARDARAMRLRARHEEMTRVPPTNMRRILVDGLPANIYLQNQIDEEVYDGDWEDDDDLEDDD